MSRNMLRSKDWWVVLPVATATFIYFTSGSLILSETGGTALQSTASVAARLVLAIVIAVAMLLSERRREHPSVDAAVLDGIQIAAVVVITNALFGSTEMGARLAARTALVLIGLPLIAVLTHWLAQRMGARDR